MILVVIEFSSDHEMKGILRDLELSPHLFSFLRSGAESQGIDTDTVEHLHKAAPFQMKPLRT